MKQPVYIVRVDKAWKRRWWQTSRRGYWEMDPPLAEVTQNLGSRIGYWEMRYIGQEHEVGSVADYLTNPKEGR